MSQQQPPRDYEYRGSVEDNLYFILMDRGRELLTDFIIGKLKLKKFKAVKELRVVFLPLEMKDSLSYTITATKIEKSITSEPLIIFAAILKSSILPFVQLPINAESIFVFLTSSTSTVS